jgi:hypothetical protein
MTDLVIRARTVTGSPAVPAPLLLVAFLVVAVWEAASGLRVVPSDGLLDPDSYMRVVRLRDILQAGRLTHVVAADNGGLGTVVYWSHLIDGFVLVLSAPFRLFVGTHEALRLGAAWTGPLTAGCTAVALVWAPAPLADRRWLWAAPFAGFFSGTTIQAYGLFGWVHHHLPLVLTTVMTVAWAGRAAHGRVSAGVWCGVWAALGIWLSSEALPYDLMAIGVVVVAWCSRPAQASAPLLAVAGTFLAVMTAATLLDPPDGGLWAPEIDCLSIAYVVLAALILGAALALAGIGRTRSGILARTAGAGLAAVAVLGAWVALYPAVVHGLSGLIPAADVQAYFGAISEMQPVRNIPEAMQHFLRAGIAVVMALWFAYRRQSLLWTYAAICGAVVIGLGWAFIRFAGYAEALGAMAAPVVVTVMFSSPALATPRGRLVRVMLLAVIMAGPSAAGLLSPTDANATAMTKTCSVSDIAPALRQRPDAIVLTGIDDTPEVLWRTPVRTVGSLYHRSIGAFIKARNAWRTSPSSTVPEAVRQTGATFILACETKGRSPLVADLPADTLEDKLMRHEPPPWLQEVARGGGYHLYKIVFAPETSTSSQ